MIKKLYDEIELNYKNLDKYISKVVDDAIDDTTLFFEKHFNDDKTLKIQNQDDEVLMQLNKIYEALEKLNFTSDEDWDTNLIFVATSLGHINEMLTKVMCQELNLEIREKDTQVSKINKLKNFIPRIMLNDLYFINTFRNSIIHPNDFNINLFRLDDKSKHKLYNEAKTAIAKTYYIYEELPSLELSNES